MPFEKFERPQSPTIKKEDFGKKVERTIAEPLFQELRRVFPEVIHTTERVDRKRGVDFIVTLPDGNHLAIDVSTAENQKVWLEKAHRVLNQPLVELKDIYPEPGSLSLRRIIEKVPRILLKINRDDVKEAYQNFENSGRQGRPIDFLPNREDHSQALLIQTLAHLRHYFSDQELAQRFPRLPEIARQRYETLNQIVTELFQQRKMPAAAIR